MNSRGFSLVELSIVLVIIGLLTGGILSGQSLIHAAELRSIATEMQQHVAAINTFKQKYMAMPGDMRNATKFWGKLSAYCNGDTGSVSAIGTCNGNGNGHLEYVDTGVSKTEHHMLWNQLALAGLISGSYTGIAGAGTNSWNSTTGVNVPASKMGKESGFIALYTNLSEPTFATNLAPYWYSMNYGNALAFGTPFEWGIMSALTPEETYSIDKKIDDGLPARGNVISTQWDLGCSDGSSTFDFDSEYRVSDSSIQCDIIFINQI